jgi:hypothetical protein
MELRKVLILLACGSVMGCADVSKQDVDALGVTLEAKISQAVAQLDQKINATDAKYASMLALEQQVKNGVEKIDANAKLLGEAGKSWLQVLQARRNALKEELRSVEDQLGALPAQKE